MLSLPAAPKAMPEKAALRPSLPAVPISISAVPPTGPRSAMPLAGQAELSMTTPVNVTASWNTSPAPLPSTSISISVEPFVAVTRR